MVARPSRTITREPAEYYSANGATTRHRDLPKEPTFVGSITALTHKPRPGTPTYSASGSAPAAAENGWPLFSLRFLLGSRRSLSSGYFGAALSPAGLARETEVAAGSLPGFLEWFCSGQEPCVISGNAAFGVVPKRECVITTAPGQGPALFWTTTRRG